MVYHALVECLAVFIASFLGCLAGIAFDKLMESFENEPAWPCSGGKE